MRALFLCGLLALLSSAPALADDCIAGDCNNGIGTLRDRAGNEISGRWESGKKVAGKYDIRYACSPAQTYAITLDAAERPVSGSAVRCGGDPLAKFRSGSGPTVFSGTWTTVSNPFDQRVYATYKTGTYTDVYGVVWEGEFEYIPTRYKVNSVEYGKLELAKGTYVFIGARIDAQWDEVKRGLYISEAVVPDEAINFTRARPDFLLSLRETFVADRNETAEERAADARASRELFSAIATVVGTTAIAYGSYKMAMKADRAMLDSLNRTVTGQKPPPNGELPRAASNRTASQPMTVSQFRGLQAAPAPSAGLTTTNTSPNEATKLKLVAEEKKKPRLLSTPTLEPTGPAAPLGGNTRDATRIVDTVLSGGQLEDHQAKTWCSRKVPEYTKSIVAEGSEMLYVGSCTCKTEGGAVSFQKSYTCSFPVKYKTNQPSSSR